MSTLRDRNLHVVFGITLMAVLGVASIAPALPSVGRALSLTPQKTGLLITVFTVPGVFLTPITGMMADRRGRRRILVPALWLFALAGGACALADGFGLLLGLRFLQGIGASALGSLNVTIVGDLYSGRERSAAMGYNMSVLSIGTASFPALGGALAELGWQWPFVLPLLAIPVALGVQRFLRNPEPEIQQSLRSYFGHVGRSLRRRAVAGLFLASLVTFVLLYGGILSYFPILMDRRFGLSPGKIGLFLTASSVATGIVAFQLGRLSRRFGEPQLIRAAFLLYAVALGLIPLLRNPWLMLLPSICFGTGMGLNVPSLLHMLSSLAPTEHRGAFMSLNGMVLRLGQTLGPVSAAMAFGWGGMEAPFYCGVGLALVTGLVLVLLLSRGRTEQAPHEAGG